MAAHPGAHIREKHLKPRKLTVTAAAELLGIGRPALSNFLNGKASTTAEMAKRLSTAFGIDAKELLAMQATYDASKTSLLELGTQAKRFVVPMFQFKAKQIEDWAHRNISARHRLAVFLRQLVNSTVSPDRCSFPGNDDAERPDWDGECDCLSGNQWVPGGHTGWEFGTNEDPLQKANGDYKKSLKLPKTERLNMTFVFVTPRHWPGKTAWQTHHVARGDWLDVRAYDSSDLEQWLEQSIPAQVWFANEIGSNALGVLGLEQCWAEWQGPTHPFMPDSLFDTAVALSSGKFAAWLKAPPGKPFVIGCDSNEEALAFLAALMRSPEFEAERDRTLVFRTPGVLSKVADSVQDFIAVAATNDVQLEMDRLPRELHCVVMQARNSIQTEADALLEPLPALTFHTALREAGFTEDEVRKWSLESGRSLTVLRRRLSKLPAARRPPWSYEPEAVRAMIPIALAGSWNSSNPADQAALAKLADASTYQSLEDTVLTLATQAESPVWLVGTSRGVLSRIDTLFAVGPKITALSLDRFFEVAKAVLSEDDPSLDLPEESRGLAGFFHKTRAYSKNLRDGIAETLVLLSVHAEHLGKLSGANLIERVNAVVQGILAPPLTARRLESNSKDLMYYAEAAPDVFLKAFADDLWSKNPATHALLRAANSLFGDCPRCELLWALESLAWNPETLLRVVRILARLSQQEIADNWSNTPFASLVAIFRPWAPQTAADTEARLRTFDCVVAELPAVGWRLGIKLLNWRPDGAGASYKPRWRNDGYGHGERVRDAERIRKFQFSVASVLLQWPTPYSAQMLCDLLEVLPRLDSGLAHLLWRQIEHWSHTAADDEKAIVRDEIRESVLSRHALRRPHRTAIEELRQSAMQVAALLGPQDCVNKHAWLFRESWIPELYDGKDDPEDADDDGLEARVHAARIAAVREVLEHQGKAGLRELAALGSDNGLVGQIAATEIFDLAELERFVTSQLGMRQRSVQSMLGAAIGCLAERPRAALLSSALEKLGPDERVPLLLLAPFCRETWHRVDSLPSEEASNYWQQAMPGRVRDEDLHDGVARLLKAGRPMTAFSISHFRMQQLDVETLYSVLWRIAHEATDEPDEYKLEQHQIVKAIGLITESPSLTLDQKAGLEFSYIESLWRFDGRQQVSAFPSLDRYVEIHPEFYVQALAWVYRRDDGLEDPRELTTPAGKEPLLERLAAHLLESMKRLPACAGGNTATTENLLAWVIRVRELAKAAGRLTIADVKLGRLLASTASGPDGIAPDSIRCNVLEAIGTPSLAEGAVTEMLNLRGVVHRARGGGQERQLAEQFRSWGRNLQYAHPFVATRILGEVAKAYDNMARHFDEHTELSERLR